MTPHYEFLRAAAAQRVQDLHDTADRNRNARLAREGAPPKPARAAGPVHAPTHGCAESPA